MAKSGDGRLERNGITESESISPTDCLHTDNGSQSTSEEKPGRYHLPRWPTLTSHGRTASRVPRHDPSKGHTALTQCSCQRREPNPTSAQTPIVEYSTSKQLICTLQEYQRHESYRRPVKLFRLTDTRHNQDWSLNWGKFATRNIFGIPRWC